MHYDPYDVTRIWVRNHHDGGWITVPWTHLRTAPAPFGELAWAHARDILAGRGTDHATESEIAGAVEALLDKAGHGPAEPGPVTARPAGRGTHPRHGSAELAAACGRTANPARLPATGEQDELAAVIPLAVFDAREEAKKWW